MDVDNLDIPLPDVDDFDIPLPESPNSPNKINAVDFKNWTCIWPVYLDSSKSVAQGRRVPKSQAHEHPHFFIIAHILQSLNLDAVIEQGKRHPRDPFLYGRIRVKLDKSHAVASSKKSLLRHISSNYSAVKQLFDSKEIQLHPEAQKAYDSLSYSRVVKPHMLERIFATPDGKPSSSAPEGLKEGNTQKAPKNKKKKSRKV